MNNDAVDAYRGGVRSALSAIREALHAQGRLSSRHEALEEISTLLLAHALDRLDGGSLMTRAGIAELARRSFGGASGIAPALQAAVSGLLEKRLAKTIGARISAADYRLRLEADENRLASAYLEALELIPHPERTGGQGGSLPMVYDLMNDVFSQFLADSFAHERQLGQYLTPAEVVKAMVDIAMADLGEEELDALLSAEPERAFGLILDPSCGAASFLTRMLHALFRSAAARFPEGELLAWLDRATSRLLVGIDKSPRMLRLALASLTLYGARSARLHDANALAVGASAPPVLESLEAGVGLILTNPPFGAEFSGQELKGYAIGQADRRGRVLRAVSSELLFIERYLTWLRPGGRLLAVVPDSILTNRGIYARLRELVRRKAHIRAVISLPSETFGLAGTSTKTSVLYLVRHGEGSLSQGPTYSGICRSLGYLVTTRGSHRSRVPSGPNELTRITTDFQRSVAGRPAEVGRWVAGVAQHERWDATYHAGLPEDLRRALDSPLASRCRLGRFARLVAEKVQPRREASSSFPYVEISGINGHTLEVAARTVSREHAPSRARKRIRAGDVLVATVRPRLRAAGVVPEHLDGAVCSTGIAVLRPHAIDAHLLARLLQTDIVTLQLIRNTIGISYPAFEQSCLEAIVLPMSEQELEELNALGAGVREAESTTRSLRSRLERRVEEVSSQWLSTIATR